MNNEALNNTLAELEDELKSMQSARSQVLGLSDTINALSKKYIDTLEKVDRISKSMQLDENYFAKNFGETTEKISRDAEESVEKVKEQLNKLITNADNTASSTKKILSENLALIQGHTQSYSKALEDLAGEMKKEGTEISKLNQEHIRRLHSEMQASFQKIEKSLDSKNKEFQEIKVFPILQNLEDNIGKIERTVVSSSTSIDKNGSTLLQVLEDIFERDLSTKKMLDLLRKDNEKRFQISLTVSGVLLIMGIILMFMVK